MNLRLGRIALNIAACLTFLSIPILLAPDANPTWDFMVNGETFRDLIAYSIMIIYFYANYFYFIPNYFLRKKHLHFYLIALAALLLVLFIPVIISPFEHHHHHGPPGMR